MEQKFLQSFNNALKSFNAADHLCYVSYPLLKENKLFLSIISELNIFSIYLINSILQYEYYYKRIQLFTDPNINLDTFRNQCIPLYGFSDIEVKSLFEVRRLAQAHKSSPMEFVKNSNIVIMTDSLRTETLNIDKIKNFVSCSKSILDKTKKRLYQSRLLGF